MQQALPKWLVPVSVDHGDGESWKNQIFRKIYKKNSKYFMNDYRRATPVHIDIGAVGYSIVMAGILPHI